MCDCDECHARDDVTQALSRLEQRDEANTRLINEMFAKINQLNDCVLTQQAQIQAELKTIKESLRTLKTQSAMNRAKSETTETPGERLEMAKQLARIENVVVGLSNNTKKTATPKTRI